MGMIIDPYRFAVAGGGGSPVTHYELYGNAASSNPGTSFASSAAQLLLVTPSQTVDVSAVSLGYIGSTGQSAKALIYTDNAGAPDVQIGVGTATSLGTVTNTPTVIDLPFASDMTLTGGVSYWIGFVPSGSISLCSTSGFGNTSWFASVTYASPEADLTGVGSMGANSPVLFAKGASTQVLVDSDLVAQSEYVAHANTSRPTWINIPEFAVGDVAFLQINPANGSPPSFTTTPSGFTLISSPNLNGSGFVGINNIYMRVVDGTENGIVKFQLTGYNNVSAKLTVWRGMDVSGTPYESLVTSTGTGTSVVSPGITTTAPNRLAVNFFGTGAGDLTGAADGWTDGYDHNTTAGTDSAISCTYRDVASASSPTAETRTNSASTGYAVVGLALIRL